jgi:hypothetical protein
VTVQASSSCSANASVDNGSSNRYGQSIPVVQSPAGPYGLGSTAVTLTGTDSRDASSSCQATVTVIDTTAPTIACPAAVTAQCTGNNAGIVTPAMATAADNCSVASITGPAAGSYPLGTTNVTYTATDGSGNTSSCSTTIRVVDDTPPTIAQLTATPNSLWPANNKMVPVSVSAVASDTCDGNVSASCRIVSVNSNEPVNASTSPGWQITGPLTLSLLAQRSGAGAGRVYTIAVQCSDGAGNTALKSVVVTVPHDQGN